MFKYKIDVLETLKAAGYSSYKLGHKAGDKPAIFGQSVIQKFRNGEKLPSWDELDKICSMLRCQPWDVVEYVPNDAQNDTI